jgi:hypothetical protein
MVVDRLRRCPHRETIRISRGKAGAVVVQGSGAGSGLQPGTTGVGALATSSFADDRTQNIDHLAHHAGSVCLRCGHTLDSDMPARRSVTDGWIHDVCPVK